MIIHPQRSYFENLVKALDLKDMSFIVDRENDWSIKDEDLARLDEVKTWNRGLDHNIIGRYRIDPTLHPNPMGVAELWFEFEAPELEKDKVKLEEVERAFPKTHEEALKLLNTLCHYFPENAIIIRASGRGFHLSVFVAGVNNVSLFIDILKTIAGKASLDPTIFREKEVYSSRRKIREFGAKNERTGTYSTYISPQEFRALTRYPFARSLNEVRYPEKIEVAQFPLNLKLDVEKYQQEEIARKALIETKIPKKTTKLGAAHLNLTCIDALYNTPLPQGERRIRASKLLAIAYYLDNGTMAGFERLAESFASFQSENGVKLRAGEVAGWIRGIQAWLRDGKKIEWNCGDIKNYFKNCKIDFTCPDDCPYATPSIMADQKETIFPDEIKVEAMKQLQSNPIEYVVKVGNMLHKGDQALLEMDWLSELTPELAQQLHLMSVGKTGKGKSHHAEVALEFLPREYMIYVTDPSPKSFFYATKAGYRFDGCVVFIDDAREEHIPILKSLTSHNRRKPRTWSVDEHEFIDINIEGNFTVWISCVSPLRDEQGQLTRRFFVVNPTESGELDEEVGRFTVERMRLGLSKEEIPPQFEVVKYMSKILKEQRCKVIVPFDVELPTDPQRTLPSFFMTILQSVAKANMFKRLVVEKDEEKIVWAEPEDFEEAKKVWKEFALYQMKVDYTGLCILDALPEEEPKGTIGEDGKETRPEPSDKAPTVSYLAKKLHESPRTIRDKLENLYDAGLIDKKWWGSWNTEHYYWKLPFLTKLEEGIKIKDGSLTPEQIKELADRLGLGDHIEQYLSKIAVAVVAEEIRKNNFLKSAQTTASPMKVKKEGEQITSKNEWTKVAKRRVISNWLKGFERIPSKHELKMFYGANKKSLGTLEEFKQIVKELLAKREHEDE